MGINLSKPSGSKRKRIFHEAVPPFSKDPIEDTEESDSVSCQSESAESLFRAIASHQKRTSLSSFDLVASNSFCSPQVRSIMSSALMNSYCIGLPGNRFYGGCTAIDEIEQLTRTLVCQVYGADYCEVQLLSGMMANIAAYNAVLPNLGCTVMAASIKHGGHYSHNAGGPLTRLFGANVVELPWDKNTYNVDVEALPLAMQTHRPVLIILGWSEMLFEHDLLAIRTICDEYECKILFDMSHVAGLIAGGVFQRDAMLYADIVTSSTGKSLHSSDHGIVLYNDASFTPKIREAVMPLLTSNTHFHETAALCMTMLEMQKHGKAYAEQVVANTRALAKELAKRKFRLLCPELGYSCSHELIVDLHASKGLKTVGGAEATKRLDAAGILVNPQDLPHDSAATGSTGLRLGTQVLTRRGFRESDMADVAKAMASVLIEKHDPALVSHRVAQISGKFDRTHFVLSDI